MSLQIQESLSIARRTDSLVKLEIPIQRDTFTHFADIIDLLPQNTNGTEFKLNDSKTLDS